MDEPGTVRVSYRKFAAPLILISPVFFSLYILIISLVLSGPLQTMLNPLLPPSALGTLGGFLFILPVELCCFLSLSGTILFLREMRAQSLPSGVGIPLCALLGLMVVTLYLAVSHEYSAFLWQLFDIVLAAFVALPFGVRCLLRDFEKTRFDEVRSYTIIIGLWGLCASCCLVLLLLFWSQSSVAGIFIYLAVLFSVLQAAFLMPILGGMLVRLGWRFYRLSPADDDAVLAAEPVPRKKLSEVLRDILKSVSPRARRAILIVIALVLVLSAGYLYWDSTDTTPGRVWTEAATTSPLDNRYGFAATEFRGNLWVFGGRPHEGSDGEALYTSNGSGWTRVSSPAMVPQRFEASSAVFRDGLFVIGGQSVDTAVLHNDVWYSGDGSTWYEMQSAAEFAPRSGQGTAVFHDKIWVVGGNLANGSPGYTDDVWYSDDAMHWQQATPSAGFPPRARHSVLVYDDQLFVIGGMNSTNTLNDVWKSGNGVNWTRVTGSAAFEPAVYPGVVFDDRMWALSNNGIWWSRDGATWTAVRGSLPVPRNRNNGQSAPVVFNNRLWIFSQAYSAGGVWYTMPSG